MFAVLGVFAAAGAESANAQTVSAAVGQVYSEVGMVTVRTSGGNRLTTSASVPVDDVWMAIDGQPNAQTPANSFFLIESGMNTAADGTVDTTSGLPTFGGNVMMAGNIVQFLDGQLGNTQNLEFGYTVRIFTDGTDLFMARGEGESAPAVVVPVSAAVVSGDEFFILGETGDSRAWTTVTALESGVVGFRAVVCDTANGYESTDDLTCNFAPSVANCALDGRGFDGATTMCVVCGDDETLNSAGMCEMSEDPPTDPTNPPPPTCAADETAANCTCPVGEMRQMSGSAYMCVADSENGGGDDTGGGSGDDDISGSGDGRNHAPVFVFGGLMLMGAVGYIMSGGDLDAFAFSPSFGYSVNESGYSANVGGRVDFVNDEWRLFWTAGQANANGDFGEFRYSSGGEYKADFWQASFSESVQGETADYDLSLSADFSGGIWSLSPVYRIHSRLEEGKTETRNSLNLEGVLRYDSWRITQSAGFGWRRMENFGDSAKFRLEAVREF